MLFMFFQSPHSVNHRHKKSGWHLYTTKINAFDWLKIKTMHAQVDQECDYLTENNMKWITAYISLDYYSSICIIYPQII